MWGPPQWPGPVPNLRSQAARTGAPRQGSLTHRPQPCGWHQQDQNTGLRHLLADHVPSFRGDPSNPLCNLLSPHIPWGSLLHCVGSLHPIPVTDWRPLNKGRHAH